MGTKFYYPQLDSLRGLSFIGIFVFHAQQAEVYKYFSGGFFRFCFENLPLAIDVFFVLSSFLLTLIGLKEYTKTGSFSFRKYFTRRILRIWPLYYLILLITFSVVPYIAAKFGYEMSMPDKWHYIFFISNFYFIDHVFFLRILWTLSVEEQFYLVLGIALNFLHKYINAVFLVFIVLSICFTVYSMHLGRSTYFHTLTYFFDFSMGGFAAYLYNKRATLVQKIENWGKAITILFYLYVPIHLFVFYIIDLNAKYFLFGLINRYLFIIYIALLIIEQLSNKNRWGILEKNRFLILTGKISFGLYCFHGMAITGGIVFLQKSGLSISGWLFSIIVFILNYMVALVSYYLYEMPFLKLKNSFRRI